MDWIVYNRNFGYGLSKFVLKGDMIEVDDVESSVIQLTKGTTHISVSHIPHMLID